jgi:hypothetical protein
MAGTAVSPELELCVVGQAPGKALPGKPWFGMVFQERRVPDPKEPPSLKACGLSA